MATQVPGQKVPVGNEGSRARGRREQSQTAAQAATLRLLLDTSKRAKSAPGLVAQEVVEDGCQPQRQRRGRGEKVQPRTLSREPRKSGFRPQVATPGTPGKVPVANGHPGNMKGLQS